MSHWKRRLKVFGQNVGALVALVLLIVSLPFILLFTIIHFCKSWISEIELKPRREMNPIENRLPSER
jgi:hypothetical protein